MKEEDFITSRVYINEDEAKECADMLTAHDIDVFIDEVSLGLIPGLENNEWNQEFRLKVRKDDLETAEKLISGYQSDLIGAIGNDYYLFQFTNDELIEILANKDQWGDLDYALSLKILRDRGVEVNDEFIEKLQLKRIQTLSEPENSEKFWIIIAYLSALCGGFLGIIFGLGLMTHKKTLPNGERVWGFSQKDRNHGRRILFIGSLMLIVTVIVLFFSNKATPSYL